MEERREIDVLAHNIAQVVFPHHFDAQAQAALKELLVQFADEIHREAIEP